MNNTLNLQRTNLKAMSLLLSPIVNGSLYVAQRVRSHGPDVNLRIPCRQQSTQVRESTLVLESTADVTRSRKKGISGPTKRDHILDFLWSCIVPILLVFNHKVLFATLQVNIDWYDTYVDFSWGEAKIKQVINSVTTSNQWCKGPFTRNV